MSQIAQRYRFSDVKAIGAFTFAALLASDSIAEDHTVRVVTDHENLRMYFDPKFLQIEKGDSVTWVNEIDEEHNVVTFPDGYPSGAKAFQSPIMTKADESWTHTFSVSGTYEYHCVPHLPMGMHGLIVVDRLSTNDEFHEPSEAEVTSYRTLLLNWFEDEDIEDLDLEERPGASDS